MMTEDDESDPDIREQAQALRESLADELSAPAEQDDHAAARKRAEDDEE